MQYGLIMKIKREFDETEDNGLDRLIRALNRIATFQFVQPYF